jgi:hypothetical protein
MRRWMWSDPGEEMFLKLSRLARAEAYDGKFELLQVFVQSVSFGYLEVVALRDMSVPWLE